MKTLTEIVLVVLLDLVLEILSKFLNPPARCSHGPASRRSYAKPAIEFCAYRSGDTT